MKLTMITDFNIRGFQNMIPEELWELGRPGLFALGAAEEADNADYARGVLIFELTDDGEVYKSGEPGAVAVIRWLFVHEDFRCRGCGNALMDAMYDTLNEFGIEDIVCDLPMDPEYDMLCAFMEDWGLVFLPVASPVLTVTLGELSEHEAFDFRKNKYCFDKVLPLREADEEHFLKGLSIAARTVGAPAGLPEDRDAYEQDVSCVLLSDDGGLSAILLVEERAGILFPRLLRPDGKQYSSLLVLLMYAVHAMKKKYEPETEIVVTCANEMTAKLADCFFPDYTPGIIRRGIYMDDEEAEYAGIYFSFLKEEQEAMRAREDLTAAAGKYGLPTDDGSIEELSEILLEQELLERIELMAED